MADVVVMGQISWGTLDAQRRRNSGHADDLCRVTFDIDRDLNDSAVEKVRFLFLVNRAVTSDAEFKKRVAKLVLSGDRVSVRLREAVAHVVMAEMPKLKPLLPNQFLLCSGYREEEGLYWNDLESAYNMLRTSGKEYLMSFDRRDELIAYLRAERFFGFRQAKKGFETAADRLIRYRMHGFYGALALEVQGKIDRGGLDLTLEMGMEEVRLDRATSNHQIALDCFKRGVENIERGDFSFLGSNLLHPNPDDLRRALCVLDKLVAWDIFDHDLDADWGNLPRVQEFFKGIDAYHVHLFSDKVKRWMQDIHTKGWTEAIRDYIEAEVGVLERLKSLAHTLGKEESLLSLPAPLEQLKEVGQARGCGHVEPLERLDRI